MVLRDSGLRLVEDGEHCGRVCGFQIDDVSRCMDKLCDFIIGSL